jgi:hypothetical protein
LLGNGNPYVPMQPRLPAVLVGALLAGCGLAADGGGGTRGCADDPAAPGCGPDVQLLDLPGDSSGCTVSAASTDGSVLVGGCWTGDSAPRSVRWERGGAATFLDLDGPTSANAVSADGAVVVGSVGLSSELGYLYDTALRNRAAVSLHDVSDDGSVVVGGGFELGTDTAISVRGRASDGNLARVPALEPGLSAMLYRISGDGRVAVGFVKDSEGTEHAASWTEDGAPSLLEVLPGTVGSVAVTVNRDGSVIVGTLHFASDATPLVPVRWTPAGVERLLSTGWGSPIDMSADGRRIIIGMGPDNVVALWQAESLQPLGSWLASLGTETSTLEPSLGFDVFGITRDGRSVYGSSQSQVRRGFIARLPE